MLDLWISKAALATIHAAADAGFPLENGGMLFGYHAPDAMVVEAATVAGGNVKRSPVRVDWDNEHDQAVASRIYRESEGKTYFLGGWHTHPGGPCLQSGLDHASLQACNEALAQFGPAAMVILAGSVGRWCRGAWIGPSRPASDIREF